MQPQQDGIDFNNGYAIAFLSALILSTTGVVIRYLLETYGIPPTILAFWRNGFLTLFLLVFLELHYPFLVEVRRRDLGLLAVYGLVLALFNLLWTTSVALNGAAVATLLVYSSAGFAAVLGWRFLNEGLGQDKVVAIILCLGGCALVSGAVGGHGGPAVEAPGILAGLLSGLSYGIYSLMGRAVCRRGLNPWTAMLYSFGFAGIFLLAFNLLNLDILPWGSRQAEDLFWLGSSWQGWGILVLLAIGPTLAGFGLYTVSLDRLPASIANLIATTEPVFTAILAYLFLGEMLDGSKLAGGALIISGVLFLQVTEGRRMKVAARA
jgi:drug/metabolite transporter (DMT)-like permease